MKIQPIKPLPSIKIVGFPPIKPLPSIKDCFNNNKKHTIMEKERKITAPDGCEIEKVELIDGVAVVTFREKERKLPKTWEEFCEMFPVKSGEFYIDNSCTILDKTFTGDYRHGEEDRNMLPDRATAEAVLALCQLIQLRNCYNGDWVPDWSKANCNICYSGFNECFEVGVNVGITEILFFKSEELADMLLFNFADLIEKLKPLYGIKKGGEQ